MSAQSDGELLTSWRAGDRAAGGELFRRHFASVQRFFRNTVEPAAVDDLVQGTFVVCVESRDRFEGRSSFRTYLFGVAHNLLRSHYRKRKSHATEPDFEVDSVVDLGVGPATMLGHKREHRVLIEALRQIPLDAQVLIQLRYWEQLRTAELAEFLGIPRGTAVDRLRRAQIQLEQALARIEASPELLASTIQSLNGWAAMLRTPGERDPQLAAVIPERLGRRPLVARTHDPGLEQARYRGNNAEVELTVRRFDPSESDVANPGTDWVATRVGERAGWLQSTAEPTPSARVRVAVGDVVVELSLSEIAGSQASWRAAARAEAAIELAATLAFDVLDDPDGSA